MAKGKFKPLELEDVDEGRFMASVNADLAAIQKALIEHVKQYGKDRTKGATAKLSISVTVKFEARDESDYSVKAATKKETPGRPPSLTVAIADEEQDGTPCLFVRNSGSTPDNPRQTVLATLDGRTVDPKTQKVKD